MRMASSSPLAKFSLGLLLTAAGLLIGLPLIEGCSESKANTSPNQQSLPKVVDFNFHIRPILSDRCYTCHGPDANKRKSGIRFDQKESALAELPENAGHYAIIPGDPENTPLETGRG